VKLKPFSDLIESKLGLKIPWISSIMASFPNCLAMMYRFCKWLSSFYGYHFWYDMMACWPSFLHIAICLYTMCSLHIVVLH
jgi:hypothetical protein